MLPCLHMEMEILHGGAGSRRMAPACPQPLDAMPIGRIAGDALKCVTCDPAYWHCVEWLGTSWGHAAAPSTPVQDFHLHVKAWQHHFAAIFGLDSLSRDFTARDGASEPSRCRLRIRQNPEGMRLLVAAGEGTLG